MGVKSRVMEYEIKSIITHIESNLVFVYKLRESALHLFLNHEEHLKTVGPSRGVGGTVCRHEH